MSLEGMRADFSNCDPAACCDDTSEES